MSAPLRLVLFDVDGTLVDSQAAILGAMNAAFSRFDLSAPGREDILGIVGLSLDHAVFRLAPELNPKLREDLVTAYKEAYHAQRVAEGSKTNSPLYPGAREVIDGLRARPDILLGVATGKSRRGLDALVNGHGLNGVFVTTQVADDHPSKPHPSMILSALAETGVDPENAVMVGDTSFDLDMAAAAGISSIGVSWGYHPRDQLHGRAPCVIDAFDELPGALARFWDNFG